MASTDGALGGGYSPGTSYNRTGATDTGGTYSGATLSGTPTLTSPTITSPTITGTTSIGTGATLTSPTLNTATLTTPTVTGMVTSDFKVLAAPAAYASTVTPAVITGFSWTVVPGVYIFEVNLPTTMTTVGGLTISFVLTTAVLTSIQYQTYASTASDNTLAVSTTGTTTTSATKVFDSKTSAYTYVKIWGSMVVGTGGTFTWDGCQNTSAGGADTSTILLGAFAKMNRVS